MENSNVRSRFNNQNRTKTISKEQNRNDNLDSNQKLKNQELNQELNVNLNQKQYLQLCLKITAVAIAFTLAIAVFVAVAMVIWYLPSLYWTQTELLNIAKIESKTNVTCKLPQLDKVCERPHAKGNGLKVAMVGEIATASVYARMCTSCELHVGGEGPTCTCTCLEDEETVSCDLESNSTIICSAERIETEDCRYRISYQPNERGNYMLNIKVQGEHIKGSPFLVTVVRNMSVPVRNLSGLSAPRGIAFNNKNGDIIVTGYTGHNFMIFHPSGKSESFGSEGSGEGQFNHSNGVAVDDDGYILVTDKRNDRLQKFTSEGEFLEVIEMNFSRPTGIGIHPHTKNIYVTELHGNIVQILNPDLSHNKTIGTNYNFKEPTDVAFDSRGNVYIADNERKKIKVFTADGEFLRMFGNLHDGDTTFQLDYPTGICIDSYDVIYVTELYKHCVSLFRYREASEKYEYLTSFGKEGPGKFNMPRGIAIDKSGLLYVSDHVNNIVQVF